jgi:bisphosphoglycerate-independent phosphoglycerate mutase (AlkP superfamily)
VKYLMFVILVGLVIALIATQDWIQSSWHYLKACGAKITQPTMVTDQVRQAIKPLLEQIRRANNKLVQQLGCSLTIDEVIAESSIVFPLYPAYKFAQLAQVLAEEADKSYEIGDNQKWQMYAQQAKQAVELAEAALKEAEAEVQKDPLEELKLAQTSV